MLPSWVNSGKFAVAFWAIFLLAIGFSRVPLVDTVWGLAMKCILAALCVSYIVQRRRKARETRG